LLKKIKLLGTGLKITADSSCVAENNYALKLWYDERGNMIELGSYSILLIVLYLGFVKMMRA